MFETLQWMRLIPDDYKKENISPIYLKQKHRFPQTPLNKQNQNKTDVKKNRAQGVTEFILIPTKIPNKLLSYPLISTLEIIKMITATMDLSKTNHVKLM